MTLIEPMISMRYAYKKKTTSLDLLDLFHTFAIMPLGGISSDADWIDMSTLPNQADTVSEAWIIPLCLVYVN